MEIQDTDCSSDISSEIDFSPKIKRSRKDIITSSDELSDTSSETTERCVSKFCTIWKFRSENENDNVIDNLQDQEWLNPSGKQPSLIPFAGTHGLKLLEDHLDKEENFYLLLVTEEIFEEIAEQTNLYATQILSQKRSNRLNKWIPTNKNEIKRLFGLLIWMDLVQLPELHLYWSKNALFVQSFPPSIMPRNRFELLLRMLHFANNENTNFEDRLYKIKPIIDKLSENFAKYYDPPEVVCIDESIIPFRGVSFRQYIKQKRHKYGMKIFKLCFKPGYTHNFEIYCGKTYNRKKMTPKDIVISLCKNIFNKGHTLCTGNWYTSIDLAEELLTRNTHLIGTIQSNCPRISKEVVQKKLQWGEMFAKENKSGITLMKWKDKHAILLLSTKHSTETGVVRRKGYNCIKPKLIFDYNEAKCSVDVSDQITAYNSDSLRKSFKWYKKLALELLLNTSVVNAWILYNSLQNKSPFNNKLLSIVEFKERLVMYLTHCQDENSRNYNLSPATTINTRKRHEIKKKTGEVSKTRRRCSSCYKENVKKLGTEAARKKTIRVITFCSDCPNEPHLCIPCFNKMHRNMRL